MNAQRPSSIEELARELALAIERNLDHTIAVTTEDPALSDLVTQVNTVLAMAKSAVTERSVLKNVLTHIPYAVWWKDRQSVLLGCNGNFANDVGVSPENVAGKTDYDLACKREQAEFFRECDQKVMSSGEAWLEIEETARRSDGAETVLLTSKVPLRNDRGEVTGILGIYTDITQRKRMETELQRAKEAAEAANLAKGDFLATVSHELRTPLTLITGPLEALLAGEAGELAPQVAERLQRMRRNVARLAALVNDLLDVAKLEADESHMHLEPVDIAEVVGGLIEDAHATAKARQLNLHFSAPDEPLAQAPLDRQMFEKIVLNLVGNALKFTPAGGHISVSVRPSGDDFELVVEDTGIGIPADKMHLLFRRFQQLDTSVGRKYEGTGLGLALVKEFTEQMGGQVSVESQEGKGTRFTVRLPRSADRSPSIAAENQTNSAAPAQRTSEGDNGGPKLMPFAHMNTLSPPTGMFSPEATRLAGLAADRATVLVAEDNPDMRAFIVESLSREYTVIAVENGAKALASAREAPPDVIVSDVMMPDMDGFELTTALKEEQALGHIPIILLTAQAGQEAVVLGLERGADDYLCKPFSPAELRARVKAAARLHRTYQDLAITLDELLETRDLLVQAEKLSLAGQLAQAVAQEIGPPLAFVRASFEQLRTGPGGSDLLRQAFQNAVDRLLAKNELGGAEIGRRILSAVDGDASSDGISEVLAQMERMEDLIATFQRLAEPPPE